MPDVLVRNVDEPTLTALKRRAALHRRSLQQEIANILDRAAKETSPRDRAELAAAIRARLAASGRDFGDSTAELREDRER